ncbi:MAG: tetratricopeptide repeat protein [Chloroflexi bacterium]|nr:tetratricopeptide repeat protein [Chloroflexota bacterium]
MNLKLNQNYKSRKMVVFIALIILTVNLHGCQNSGKQSADKVVQPQETTRPGAGFSPGFHPDLAQYQTRLKEEPGNNGLILVFSDRLIQENYLTEAKSYLVKLLKQKPTTMEAAKARLFLGEIEFYKKTRSEKYEGIVEARPFTEDDFKDAISNYTESSRMLDKVKENQAEVQKARMKLAYHFYDCHALDSTLKEVRKVYNSLPDSPDAYNARILEIQVLLDNNDKALALSKLKRMEPVTGKLSSPQFFNFFYQLGYTYFRLGEYEKATPPLKKAVSLEPEVPGAYECKIYLALIQLKQGDVKGAVGNFRDINRMIKERLCNNAKDADGQGGVLFGMMLMALKDVPGNKASTESLSGKIQKEIDTAQNLFKAKDYSGASKHLDNAVYLLSNTAR